MINMNFLKLLFVSIIIIILYGNFQCERQKQYSFHSIDNRPSYRLIVNEYFEIDIEMKWDHIKIDTTNQKSILITDLKTTFDNNSSEAIKISFENISTHIIYENKVFEGNSTLDLNTIFVQSKNKENSSHKLQYEISDIYYPFFITQFNIDTMVVTINDERKVFSDINFIWKKNEK